MGSRQGGRNVAIYNVDQVLEALEEIEDGYLRPTSIKLRRYSRYLANTELIPALQASADASGIPIAGRMAATSRPKSDRIVVVKIGTVNPKLSGFRSGIGEGKGKVRKQKVSGLAIASTSQSYRTTLAFGSDRGPMGDINYYKTSRSRSHWVLPTLGGPVFDRIKDRYSGFLSQALAKYGRNR